MQFESHSIELPDGRLTMPEEPLLRDSGRCQAALRAMRTFCPIEPGRRPRVVDLGAREGGFALEFALAGYDVMGIEVRQSNVERAQMVAAAYGLPNLRFVCDDVRNVADHGRFDIAFCCGLLYHLDRPIEHLRALGAITDRLLILNTHYSERAPTPAFSLSEMVKSEGVPGRWYTDLPPGVTFQDMEDNRGASWGNEFSFWVEKRHLLQTIRDVGFDMVVEQYDFLDDIPTDAVLWMDEQTRSQFLGVKTGA